MPAPGDDRDVISVVISETKAALQIHRGTHLKCPHMLGDNVQIRVKALVESRAKSVSGAEFDWAQCHLFALPYPPSYQLSCNSVKPKTRMFSTGAGQESTCSDGK